MLNIRAELLFFETEQPFLTELLSVPSTELIFILLMPERQGLSFMTENNNLNFMFTHLSMYPKESTAAELLCCFPEPPEIGAGFVSCFVTWNSVRLEHSFLFIK